MKRTRFLLIVLLINSTLLFSQGIYFKASSNYNFKTITQQMPEYFSYKITVPSYFGWGNTYSYNINFSVNEFSVSSGRNLQGAVGYSFNDFLSFEIKFSTFGNSKKEFEASPKPYGPNGKTEWNLHSYSLLPTILFGQTFNKSTINIFVYSGFGFSKLNIKASLDENFREYKLDENNTFSWGYGLDYAYTISKHFSLFTNIGINNTNIEPKKAKLISSSSSMEYMTVSQKEIQYVNEITNLELGYYGSSDPNSPEIRFKETLKLNSVYWGIGIKYTLKK
jgi:hypothetical protein